MHIRFFWSCPYRWNKEWLIDVAPTPTALTFTWSEYGSMHSVHIWRSEISCVPHMQNLCKTNVNKPPHPHNHKYITHNSNSCKSKWIISEISIHSRTPIFVVRGNVGHADFFFFLAAISVIYSMLSNVLSLWWDRTRHSCLQYLIIPFRCVIIIWFPSKFLLHMWMFRISAGLFQMRNFIAGFHTTLESSK